MPRVVADTNIYISAFNFGGQASRLMELAQEGSLALFVSPAILQEFQGVLIGKFKWSRDQALAAVSNILRFAELVHPTEFLQVVREDPSDDRILECALAAGAAFIVSGDVHLRKLGQFRGTSILGLRGFLDAFDKA